ncbi:MAG: AzlC family ABC transporter permease [Clostridium sp.]|nr:AzlC family ABC transporter permease [Clostridium sp.]
MNWKTEYKEGLAGGLAIGLGYLPVSFTYGFMAVSGGLPVWVAVLISLTNLTSAGQFAGTNLIFAGAGYLELTLTVLVINLRYMLMSLSLSQRLERGMSTVKRLLFSFGITDETFVVASVRKGDLTFPYLMGLITLPIVGWSTGTALGACITGLLTPELQSAMGIALYAMFIAIIIPPARESHPIVVIIVTAVAAGLVMRYVPVFGFISSGFRIILATVIGAAVGAKLFPRYDADGNALTVPVDEKGEG